MRLISNTPSACNCRASSNTALMGRLTVAPLIAGIAQKAHARLHPSATLRNADAPEMTNPGAPAASGKVTAVWAMRLSGIVSRAENRLSATETISFQVRVPSTASNWGMASSSTSGSRCAQQPAATRRCSGRSPAARSRIVSNDSWRAASIKPHVFTMRISASSGSSVGAYPARCSKTAILLESTVCLGHPNEAI